MRDPNPEVTGGGMDFLNGRGIDTRLGVCETEARRLNEIYVKYSQTKRPFAVVKCAATLDGQIATRTGDSKWVTGTEARHYVHWLRHSMAAILVGVGTIAADDPSLTTRIDGFQGLDPIRIILDTHLTISENARVLRLSSESDTILVTGPEVSADKLTRIEKSGNRVVSSPLKDGRIDLDPLMDRLSAMGITSLLIEGGGRVVASALASGIVDKIFFFYAPKILGGNDGVSVCCGTGAEKMSRCIRVKDIALKRLGDDILIEGYICLLES
jgi:diaminohydroxyphosphoribosylaminopyrimidine deaminase/5-amino-6-(5-phosphoribosylamino)uracil reductase